LDGSHDLVETRESHCALWRDLACGDREQGLDLMEVEFRLSYEFDMVNVKNKFKQIGGKLQEEPEPEPGILELYVIQRETY
jgi:hypothetical protein